MSNTIKKTSISYNISSNNNYNSTSIDNRNIANNSNEFLNNVEDFDFNDTASNNYDNDNSNVHYNSASATSTEKNNNNSSDIVKESSSDNRKETIEINNFNSSSETDASSVQNEGDSVSSNSNKNNETFVSTTQNGVRTETANNKTNSGTTTSSVPNGVDSATINSDKNSNNNEMSQSSMNDGNGVGTSGNSGTPPIGAYDNNPPVAGGNYPNSGTSSENSSSYGRSDASNGENINNQNINNNGVSSSSLNNVSSSTNNPNGEWFILANEEYLKIYQELLDSIEKQIGVDGEISSLLREIRFKYVNYAMMDGMDEKQYNEQIEQQIHANIDKVDQYVREHSDYDSYAELMQSKAEFEADKAACEQMIKYYTNKPIWEEYYNKLEIAKKEMPPQTGIAGKRGLKGDPINKIQRLDSYEDQLIELFGENYKEVFAQYGLDLDFDYVQLYNYIYENKGEAAAEEFYKFAEENIKSLAGLVDALEETSLLSKDKWYSTVVNFVTAHLEGIGYGTVSSFEGVMHWFEENPSKTETDYQSMWYMLMLQTNEFGAEDALTLSYQVGQGTGQMLPAIAISMLIGMICPEGLALPMGVALEGSTVAEIGASAFLFASTGGRDYAEQMQNGMSRDQAILHGIATGGLEVTTEKLLGGLSVFGHESPTNLKQLFISMAKEGGQEVTQDLLSEILLGDGIPSFETNEEAIEYFKQKGMTFVVAALSAGEIEGGSTAVSIHNINDIYNNYINNPNIDVTEADLANLIRRNFPQETVNMSDAEVIGKYNEACLDLLNQIRANDVNETNNSSDYNQGTVSSNSDNRIYTDENGMQCTKDDLGPNPNKFFDGELELWNSKGYIDEQTGAYLESLFDGEHDVYIKTIHSTDLDSIYNEGLYCNNNATSGANGTATSANDVNFSSMITEVDSLFELSCILKSATANGVSQGGNPINGTLILAVPKGTDLHQYVYESNISNGLCLSPEIISSFVQVDSSGTVSEPIMYQDYIQSKAENERIESIQSDLNMFALGIMDSVDIENLSIDDLRIRVSELLEGHIFSDGTKLTIDDVDVSINEYGQLEIKLKSDKTNSSSIDASQEQALDNTSSDVVVEKLSEETSVETKDAELIEEINNNYIFQRLIERSEVKVEDIIENVKEICDEIGCDYTNVKVIGHGESSITLDIGNQVIKISTLPVNQDMINETDGLVADAKNLKTIQVNKYGDVNIYTMEKLDISGITEADVIDMFCKLREKGYVWGDLRTDNLGRNSNGDIQLLDYGQIFKEGSHDADFTLRNMVSPDIVKKSEIYLNNKNTNVDNSSIDSLENGTEIVESKEKLVDDVLSEYFSKSWDYVGRGASKVCYKVEMPDGSKYAVLSGDNINVNTDQLYEITNTLVEQGVSTPNFVGIKSIDGVDYQIWEYCEGDKLTFSRNNSTVTTSEANNLSVNVIDSLADAPLETYLNFIEDLDIMFKNNVSVDHHPDNIIYNSETQELQFIDIAPNSSILGEDYLDYFAKTPGNIISSMLYYINNNNQKLNELGFDSIVPNPDSVETVQKNMRIAFEQYLNNSGYSQVQIQELMKSFDASMEARSIFDGAPVDFSDAVNKRINSVILQQNNSLYFANEFINDNIEAEIENAGEITKETIDEIIEESLLNSNISYSTVEVIYNDDNTVNLKFTDQYIESIRETVSREIEIERMIELNELALPVAELMKKNSNITFEQGKTLSEIYFNDNTIEVQYIVPSLADDVRRLQRMAMEEGMTLKEYGNQKSEVIVSPEYQLEADTIAKQVRLLAEMKEPSVTEDMKSLEKNGNFLVGLDKNLKSVGSLSRKIISDASKHNTSLETAVSEIGDSLRYTLICSEDTFTEDVRSSLLELQEKGYKIEKFKNKFDEVYYHGINVNLLTPDGTIIELQFHTEQSFLAKGEMTHIYYEIARNDFTSQEAKDLANQIQEGVTKLVPQPDGVLDLNVESVTLKQNDFKIDLSSNNEQQLINTIHEVQAVTEPPVGYNTIEEYKSAFISQLINTEGFDSLSNKIIIELCTDPTMFDSLLENTDKIENLFIKNYYNKKAANYINEVCLKKVDINEVNTLLNKPKMKEYLSSLSPAELVAFYNNFSSVYGKSLNSSDAIIDILCNYDVNQLIEFGKSVGFNQFIPNDISNTFNRENVFKLYNHLIDEIYLSDNAGQLSLLNSQLFGKIIPRFYFNINNDSSFSDIHKQLDAKNSQLLKQISDSVINNAELDGLVSRTPGVVCYNVDEANKYYEVKYEIDGKEFSTVLNSDSFSEITLTNLMQSPEVIDAIMRNAFVIKDIKADDIYNRMNLTSESGLKDGINYVTCKIDGEIKNIIVSGDSKNLNNDFKNVKEFEIVNIESIENINVICNDTDFDKYLKVSYTIDGIEKTIYLSPSKSGNQLVFNIENFILQNDLFGAKVVNTEIVDNVDLTVNNIQNLSSFNEIFNDSSYGGNQSAVPQIVKNYLSNNTINDIEQQKGKLMVDLIRSYYPSANDAEIIHIAEAYADVGCAYMSASNAFMTYIASLENGEEIFKNKFGFDLKVSDSSSVSYNLEALALDIFLNKSSQSSISLDNLRDINLIDGVSLESFKTDISGYFKEKGIILHSDIYITDSLNKDSAALAYIASNPNRMYILGASGFDIELSKEENLVPFDHALDDMIQEGKIIRNIGSHSMFVTGVDEQGNLIVSTWGQKATVIGGKYQNGEKGTHYRINSIWFELDE